MAMDKSSCREFYSHDEHDAAWAASCICAHLNVTIDALEAARILARSPITLY
jgi:hypothetical protein